MYLIINQLPSSLFLYGLAQKTRKEDDDAKEKKYKEEIQEKKTI